MPKKAQYSDEIRRILVTGVANDVMYDTGVSRIPYLRHRGTFTTRPPIAWIMVRLVWHGVGLSLKLSYTRNGLVVDEMRRIVVRQQCNQAGVVNKP